MQTADGSPTITIPAMGVTYHSRHGAVQESMHVFIAAGYQQFTGKPGGINMLEMGFGTGLNALLTLGQAVATGKPTYYHALELYPLQSEEYADLGYAGLCRLHRISHCTNPGFLCSVSARCGNMTWCIMMLLPRVHSLNYGLRMYFRGCLP